MSNVLMCLQLSPIDADSALDLAKLIFQMEQDQPTQVSVQWLVSYRRDTPLSRVYAIQSALGTVFDQVWVLRAEEFADGWPGGSNALWRSAMNDVLRLHQLGEIMAEGVLTMEADCVPLQSNWIDLLDQEYHRRTSPVVGNVHSAEIETHVNGNSIWPVWLAKDWPEMMKTPKEMAWDYFHREFVLPRAQDTNLLTQYYRRKQFTSDEWHAIQKNGVRPALLHGVKDASARTLARTHLLRGPKRPIRRGLPGSMASRSLQPPGKA